MLEMFLWFFRVETWLEMGFSWSEINQHDFPATKGHWNLGSVGETSPAIFFQSIKKIKNNKTPVPDPFSRGPGSLGLPNLRDWVFFAFFFKFYHLIFDWLLIEQHDLFWFYFIF